MTLLHYPRPLRAAGAACGLALLLLSIAPTAEASHNRFGRIECVPTANPGEVTCTVTQAWRTTFWYSTPSSPSVGDTSPATSTFRWGDGATESVRLTISSISVAQDWFIGSATFTHTYSSSGSYQMGWSGCCRIFGLENRESGDYDVFGTLIVDAAAAPAIDPTPTSSVAPIVGVPQSSTAGVPVTFALPASDPLGESVQCRLSTDAEAGGGPSPTGLSVNSDCTIDWDNAILASGLYTVQVIIEEGGGGSTQQSIPVDFLLDLGVDTGSAPACAIAPAGPINVNVGDIVSYSVTGTDPDMGDMIELAEVTVPAFGTMSPTLPVSGISPVSSTFTGTPTATGTFFGTYSVSDDAGNVSQCDITIVVTDDTEAPVCGALALQPVDGTYEVVSSATDNVGIERLTFTTLTPNLDGFVEGFAGFSQGDFVTFTPPDPDISFGARFTTLSAASFFVTVEDAAGNTAVCDPVLTDLAGALPEATALLPSYPNPARVGSAGAAVTVPFRLAEAADVRVAVYDVLGREVAVLADGAMEAGSYEVAWPEASSLPSGSYVVRMAAGAHVQTQRLTLVR